MHRGVDAIFNVSGKTILNGLEDSPDAMTSDLIISDPRKEQEAIAAIGLLAVNAVELGELLGEALRLLAKTLGADFASIMELDEDGSSLFLKSGYGWPDGAVMTSRCQTGRWSHAGFVVQSRECVSFRHLRHEPRFESEPFLIVNGVCSGIGIPLFANGQVFGCLGVYSVHEQTFADDCAKFIGAIGNILIAAMLRKVMEARLAFALNHDTLTGLPNRGLFMDRLSVELAHSRRKNVKLALLFIDVDRFKSINDTLGHHFGDVLLREVARRIKESLRESDTVARLGGDEFVAIMPDVESVIVVQAVTDRLVKQLNARLEIEGCELSPSVSIGISLYPVHGTEIEQLINHADSAMYHAKQNGRNTFQFFNQTIRESIDERNALESGLRHALQNDELSLHYQPKVDLKSNQLIGVEALLRWDHPTLGPVPPAKFIPIAEDSRLIMSIGEWVLRQACRQWNDWHLSGQSIPIAINISMHQLQSLALPTLIHNVKAENGMPPGDLEIEITESAAMSDPDVTGKVLSTLRASGVRIAIDDFGTGYSSLAYLKQFSVDVLKIDRSFIRDIDTDPSDYKLVSAMVMMSHGLGLQVVAEGVETGEQLERLKACGCDFAQGYYFGHPVLPEAVFSNYASGSLS